MRSLLPNKESNPTYIPSDKEQYVTQSEYDALVALVNEYEQSLETAIGNFDQWKADIQQAFATGTLTTEQLNAINADISGIISAANITANAASVDSIQGNTANIHCVTANCVTSPIINATNANLTCVTSADIVTDNLTVNNAINYSSVNADNANITNASISCANITDASIHEASVFCIDADTVQACTGCIDTANITDADIANLIVNNKADIPNIDNTYITHNKLYQTYTDPDDFYLQLPKFSNGSYRLIGTVNDVVKFSIEIYNSTNNFFVRWSDPYYYLVDMYIGKTDEVTPSVYLHLFNQASLLNIYFQADAYDTVEPPTGYNEWPIDPTEYGYKYYEFNSRYGNWFSRNIITPSAAAEPLTLMPTSCYECTCSCDHPMYYDLSEEICYNLYRPDQELNKQSSVEFNQIEAKDVYDPEDPSTLLSEGLITTPNLSVTCVASLPHVTAMTGEPLNPETIPDGHLLVDCNGAFIKHTGVDTCPQFNPLASFHAECYPIPDNALLAYNCEDNSIKPADDVNIVGNLTITGCTTACGPIYAKDAINAKNISTTDDVIIGGDLYICGKEYVSDVEAIESNSDYLVLRSNNNASLGNNYSGVVVNNYNGTDNLAVVTDCTGELRISTGGAETVSTLTNTYLFNNNFYDSTITPVTAPDGYLSSFDNDELLNSVLYNNAFYTFSNNKWYEADIDSSNKLVLGAAVTDSTIITALEALPKRPLFYYRTAVYKEISVANAEPIATRDEAVNMADGAPTIWNATCNRLETLAANCAGQKLVTVEQSPSTFTYEWQDDVAAGTICRYTNNAAYLADVANIPVNAIVVIDDEADYLMSEDR